MNLKYYNLPFGAQLLLWTSRVFFHGSCRLKPNKYELVDLAYAKVGIENGARLLRQYLYLLRIKTDFQPQSICKQGLNEQEIKVIKCIEEHKKINFDNCTYINFWNLYNSEKLFTKGAKNLALAFKKANLNTNIEFLKNVNNAKENLNSFYKTLH